MRPWIWAGRVGKDVYLIIMRRRHRTKSRHSVFTVFQTLGYV